MRIKRMTAAFGALENAVLEPGPGLTVITAPNESGKSTWAGFLKAMLYGIDTRERDRTGFLADKTRYQPWSGAPMAGEMLVEWQGKDILLRRFPTRTNPFGGFEAVYTATGDPVPGLTAADVGERLTGVGREVYLRSAFVGQGGAAIGASKELEARVSALATSGQEDVSYSAVERTLKDWRNRRRANRSVGLIPELEEERSRLDSALREMEQTRCRKESAEQELVRLEEQRRELQAGLDVWARIERHELNRRYGEAYREWERAREALPKETSHPLFGTMSGEEAWALAQERQRERDEAVEENRRREARRAEAERQRQRGRMELLTGIFLGLLMLLMLAAKLLEGTWFIAALAGMAVLGSVWCLLDGRKLARRAEEAAAGDTSIAAGSRNVVAIGAKAPKAAGGQGESFSAAEKDAAKPAGRNVKTKEQRRAEAEARNARNKKLAGTKKRLSQVEKALASSQARYDELMALMASEELYNNAEKFDEAMKEYSALKKKLPALEEEWLELSAQLEEAQQDD